MSNLYDLCTYHEVGYLHKIHILAVSQFLTATQNKILLLSCKHLRKLTFHNQNASLTKLARIYTS